eukprot:TRINITY_DN4613_c0_g1_i3.p1 TRINITY_DN4613_c0_g1~~TRINITY_DN4613_c0_g1_i3.p1  ORF type:complete len:549 (+),score=66.83 TRINITY_DN4613_c0_g1_i3:3-1649(+)
MRMLLHTAVLVLLSITHAEIADVEQCGDAELTGLMQVQQESVREKKIRGCIASYADALDAVRPNLGASIRKHPLKPKTTSSRRLILGAGAGSTATRSLAQALRTLNLTVSHWRSMDDLWKYWTTSLLGVLGGNPEEVEPHPTAGCQEQLREFDYLNLPYTDALLDTPVAKLFLSIFLTFPKAKVILSTRPSADWAANRVKKHPFTFAPMQEPCGLTVHSFSAAELGKMLDLHNDLVRCLVPKDQLMEFDIWKDPPEKRASLMTTLGSFCGISATSLESKVFPKFDAGLFQVKRKSISNRAHIFFMNMEGRRDRLDCMMKQVDSSPYSVTRMESVTMQTLQTVCPDLDWQNSLMDRPEAQAILCSNYKIWLKAAEVADTEFIIVFEDDAILPKGHLAWQTVDSLLSGSCQDYDYIAVDTYDQQRSVRDTVHITMTTPDYNASTIVCKQELPDQSMFRLQGIGAHMQIIRTSALRSLISQVRGLQHLIPADRIFEGLNLRTRSWAAGIVKQYGKTGTSDQDRKLSGCNQSVAHSLHTHSVNLALREDDGP